LGFCGRGEREQAKAKAIFLSLRPAGYAPAFGRAVHAFRRGFFRGAEAPR